MRYADKRVILHASALVADAGPRFAIHGTGGSFTNTDWIRRKTR
ncbi:hypothetical protein [Chromobacterium sphagni]|nr:hypothetical protein [Chromobacterium sphagni]